MSTEPLLQLVAPQAASIRSFRWRNAALPIAFAAGTAFAVSGTTLAQSAPPASNSATPQVPDRAAAYYHYSLAHSYEEMATNYNMSEYATRAIEEYKLALNADPASKFLNNGLADLYFKTGKIKEAIVAAQDLLKKDPNNLDAHKLLGRIYLRSLGDGQSGGPSGQVLQLAIDEYTKISETLNPAAIAEIRDWVVKRAAAQRVPGTN